MRPSEVFDKNRAAIRRVASCHRVSNVRVFGSVLSGNDREGSDLDLLVDPTPQTSLMDIGAILGVSVDVLTPDALPERIRDRILHEAVPV